MKTQMALHIAVFLGVSFQPTAEGANAPRQGQGDNQANTMGGGVAPIPDSGEFRVFNLAGHSNMTGSGVWWINDRGPDGSPRCLKEFISDGNPKASTIDLFTKHRKTIEVRETGYPTCISSPYARVMLGASK